MTLIAAIISLLIPALLGLWLLAWTCHTPPFSHRAGNLALAHMVGSGAITILLLLSQICAGRLMPLLVYLFLILLLAGSRKVSGKLKLLWSPPRIAEEEKHRQRSPVAPGLLLTFIAVCALITLAVGFKSGLGWDAWTFWQLKARAFYIDGNLSYLKDFAHCFHPDYPPLIPLQSYWVFSHARSIDDVWPQILGAFFYLDLLLIAYASCRTWLGNTPSLACVALIASSRVVQKFALAGYADVAAAVYMLALAFFLVRRFVDRDRSAGVPLMWMLAFTCLIKNESLAWTLAALLAIAGFGIFQRQKASIACFLAFAAGYLPWFWLQKTWGLNNDVVSKPASNIPFAVVLAGILDVLKHFVRYALSMGPQYPAWGLLTVLVLAGLLLAIRRRNRHVFPLALLLVIQFTSYTVILIWAIWINPNWYPLYMGDTMHRFLLQVFPSAALLAALGCFERKAARETMGSLRAPHDAVPPAPL